MLLLETNSITLRFIGLLALGISFCHIIHCFYNNCYLLRKKGETSSSSNSLPLVIFRCCCLSFRPHFFPRATAIFSVNWEQLFRHLRYLFVTGSICDKTSHYDDYYNRNHIHSPTRLDLLGRLSSEVFELLTSTWSVILNKRLGKSPL